MGYEKAPNNKGRWKRVIKCLTMKDEGTGEKLLWGKGRGLKTTAEEIIGTGKKLKGGGQK